MGPPHSTRCRVRPGPRAGPEHAGVLPQPQNLPPGQSLKGANMNSISLSPCALRAPWYETCVWESAEKEAAPINSKSSSGFTAILQEQCPQGSKRDTNPGRDEGMRGHSNFYGRSHWEIIFLPLYRGEPTLSGQARLGEHGKITSW